MNEQLYRQIMDEVSDLQLLSLITRNVRELIHRNLVTPDEAETLVTVLTNASHRAEGAAIALNKLKENLS